MDLQTLLDQQRHRLLFECISGSRAYGTSVAHSDTDWRGVFAQSALEFLALEAPAAQLSDQRSDSVYYSLRRCLQLLAEANPNMLELLYMPSDCVRVDSEEMALLRTRRELFITRQCADSHIGYALSQIKKARGNNKWIHQPKSATPPRKEDFCYVIPKHSLADGKPCRPRPLQASGIDLAECHASRLEHAQGAYRLYRYGSDARGVFRNENLALESIPAADEATRFVGLLLYNEAAWRQSFEDHRNYWHWRATRNPARWQAQERGELDFDAKNLMHTVRLLLSGQSILHTGEPIVRFEGEALALLLRIRHGELSYDEILAIADDIRERCTALREHSDLPETADLAAVDRLLRELTAHWEARCASTPPST